MTPHDAHDEAAAIWAIKLGDDALSPAEREDFQRWLDSDPANVDRLASIVGAWEAVDRYAASAPMMTLREEALATARRMHARTPGMAIQRPPVWMLVAACLCLVFAGISVWYAQQPTFYSTGRGERQIVVLDDGSKLSLDAGTRVKVRYTRDGRQFWLQEGRASFKVAKNPLRPFSVSARGKLVVATGTEFSVELIGRETRVILYEGHVAVLDGDARPRAAPGMFDKKGSAGAGYVMLDPGEELVITPSATAAAGAPTMAIREPANPLPSADWEAGQLVFENEPLTVVVERTNRYAETPLRLGDARVGLMRVSGVFRADDTANLTEGLAATLGIASRPGKDAIILTAPGDKE